MKALDGDRLLRLAKAAARYVRPAEGAEGPSPERPFWLMQAECGYFGVLEIDPRVEDERVSAWIQDEVAHAAADGFDL